MTTALKKIETKAMQLGPKFSPDKCEAIWFRSNDPDWNFKIAEEEIAGEEIAGEEIAGEEIPWRESVK